MDKILKLRPLEFIKQRLMRKIFNSITKKSMDIFVRGNDLASVRPQIFGVHEESLTKFIEKAASQGSSDFFLDIGANIGLTSCQNGSKFKKIICFEPNPLVANILKTNLSIRLNDLSFEVREFALGENDGSFDLYIPKHNWGGAFIKENNGYSDEVLYKKDGFDGLKPENYTVRRVEVKRSETVFDSLFSSLRAEGLTKGVIKIDVEGFEKMVISSIGKTLPAELDVVIVFENWSQNLDLNEIKKNFSSRDVSVKQFTRTIVGTNKSKVRKIIEFGMLGETTFITDCAQDEVGVGDIIMTVT